MHPVGPWRPVLRRLRTQGIAVSKVDARVSVNDGDGRLALRCIIGKSIARDLRQRYGVTMPIEETEAHQAKLRVREAPVLSAALPQQPGAIPGRVIDSAPTAA